MANDLDRVDVAHQLRERLKQNLRTQSQMYLEIGLIFIQFRDEKYYKDLGYDTWTEFLTSGEFGIKPSTAYAYMEIYELFVIRWGIMVDQLVGIPYDKLRMTLPVARRTKTKEETEELVSKATELSRSDILKEMGQMTEEGKPIGWHKTVKMKTCDTCGHWKSEEQIELCQCSR